MAEREGLLMKEVAVMGSTFFSFLLTPGSVFFSCNAF